MPPFTIDPIRFLSQQDPIGEAIRQATGGISPTLTGAPTIGPAPAPAVQPLAPLPQAQAPTNLGGLRDSFADNVSKAIPAQADEQAKAALKSYEAGVIHPKLGKVIEGLREAVYSQDETRLGKAMDQAVEAFGSPKFSKDPGKWLFDMTILKGGLSRAANETAMSLVKGIMAEGMTPRKTVEAIQSVPGAMEQMQSALLPSQFEVGGANPTRPVEVAPTADLSKFITGVDSPIPSAVLTPDQATSLDTIAKTGLGPELAARIGVADVAHKTAQAEAQKAIAMKGHAVPEKIQEATIRFNARIAAMKEANPNWTPTAQEELSIWEDSFAGIEPKPLPGSAKAIKQGAEAKQEVAKAENIGELLTAQLNQIRADINKTETQTFGESAKNVDDAAAAPLKLNLLRKQAENIESEIKARKTGATHWEQMYKIAQAKGDLAKEQVELAQKLGDEKLFEAGQKANTAGMQALITFAKEDKDLVKDPNWLGLMSQYTEMLRIPFRVGTEGKMFKDLKVEPTKPGPAQPLPVPQLGEQGVYNPQSLIEKIRKINPKAADEIEQKLKGNK